MDTSDVLEELDRTSARLAAMQPGIEALRRGVRNTLSNLLWNRRTRGR